MLEEEPEIQVVEQFFVTVESCIVNVRSHSNIELHVVVELQSNNVELIEREVHNDSKVEQMIIQERTEPRLSKYVS